MAPQGKDPWAFSGPSERHGASGLCRTPDSIRPMHMIQVGGRQRSGSQGLGETYRSNRLAVGGARDPTGDSTRGVRLHSCQMRSARSFHGSSYHNNLCAPVTPCNIQLSGKIGFFGKTSSHFHDLLGGLFMVVLLFHQILSAQNSSSPWMNSIRYRTNLTLQSHLPVD